VILPGEAPSSVMEIAANPSLGMTVNETNQSVSTIAPPTPVAASNPSIGDFMAATIGITTTMVANQVAAAVSQISHSAAIVGGLMTSPAYYRNVAKSAGNMLAHTDVLTLAAPGGGAIPGILGDIAPAEENVSSVLSVSDFNRIENAATRINKPITVVGSRASGTANAYSDWDYVIEGLTNSDWKKIKNSLPGSKSVINNTPRNIDIFTTPVNPDLPSITIHPR